MRKASSRLWRLLAESDHILDHGEEGGAEEVLALSKNGIQVVATPLELPLVHGEGEGHVRGQRVNVQGFEEAGEVRIGGEIVDLNR